MFLISFANCADSFAFAAGNSNPQDHQFFITHPGLTEPLLGGKLTPFWAQEYVGADFARGFVREHNGETQEVSIGVSDTEFVPKSLSPNKISQELRDMEFEHSNYGLPHGTPVMQLIGGEEPIGVAEKAKFNLWVKCTIYDKSKLLKEVLRVRPQILNMSHHVGENRPGRLKPEAVRDIKKISELTILVIGAGNDYPKPVEKAEFELRNNAILVASLSPLGTMSHFSSESTGITIAALCH